MADSEIFDLIVVGSGLAGSFFLSETLRLGSPRLRVAVVERGPRHDHPWQVNHRRPGSIESDSLYRRSGGPSKTWRFTVGFGGGSNCWWAGTHRFHPSDFALKSRHGIGRDWPFGYAELEPYYCQAEEIMAVSGDPALTDLWRSRPFPQPPHRLTRPDELLKGRYPNQFAAQPTARARQATPTRPACCANGVCEVCPKDAKFTVLNGFSDLYGDPRVHLHLETEAVTVEIGAGLARGVNIRDADGERLLRGDLVVLAANGIFNPHLMLRSGVQHPKLGRGLHEQLVISADVLLGGLDSFQGSTSFSGYGLMLYDGADRATGGACLIETSNLPQFRNAPGRWRQRASIKLSVEALPNEANRVVLDPDWPDRALAHFESFGEYAATGMERAKARLEGILSPWPIEGITFGQPKPADGHIIGTTAMADSPAEGVVDSGHLCHSVRNLVVLGSSVFPTGTAMNPSLTICALALKAAHALARAGSGP